MLEWNLKLHHLKVMLHGRNVVKLVTFVFLRSRDVRILADLVPFNGILSIRYEVAV